MKKLLGLTLLLIGCLLGIVSILTLAQLGTRMPETTDNTNKLFFIIGFLGACLITAIPAFFCIKYGIKKMKEQDKIY